MKTICIEVSDDGQMSVGIEPAGEEMSEGGGKLEDMPGMASEGGGMGMGEGGESKEHLTPVRDEEELMMKVSELLAQIRPQGAGREADMPDQGDAQLAAGFNKQRGGML